jgi:1,4-alpha-glucan branching enzyme
MLTEQDVYLFREGNFFRAYGKLGARPLQLNGAEGARFAVWAPNAKAVSVIGDFNGWDASAAPSTSARTTRGSGSCSYPGARGALYKFLIASRFDGFITEKAIRSQFRTETPPLTLLFFGIHTTRGTIANGWPGDGHKRVRCPDVDLRGHLGSRAAYHATGIGRFAIGSSRMSSPITCSTWDSRMWSCSR